MEKSENSNAPLGPVAIGVKPLQIIEPSVSKQAFSKQTARKNVQSPKATIQIPKKPSPHKRAKPIEGEQPEESPRKRITRSASQEQTNKRDNEKVKKKQEEEEEEKGEEEEEEDDEDDDDNDSDEEDDEEEETDEEDNEEDDEEDEEDQEELQKKVVILIVSIKGDCLWKFHILPRNFQHGIGSTNRR